MRIVLLEFSARGKEGRVEADAPTHVRCADAVYCADFGSFFIPQWDGSILCKQE